MFETSNEMEYKFCKRIKKNWDAKFNDESLGMWNKKFNLLQNDAWAYGKWLDFLRGLFNGLIKFVVLMSHSWFNLSGLERLMCAAFNESYVCCMCELGWGFKSNLQATKMP